MHHVGRTQLVSAGWWRNALAGASRSPQGWQHWEEHGGTGFPPAQLGCRALAAPVPGPWGTPGPGWDPNCCGQAKGTPHSVWGLPTLQCLLHNNQLELLSGAWTLLISEQGHLPTFCIITKGEEYVLHLIGFFYTWKLTKGFGPFIEAEIHGQRRKGRKQVAQIQFLEIHPIDEVIGLFRCNGSSFFELLFH